MPHDKHDLARAEAIVAQGYPAVAPALPDILACVQDPNWPMAQVFLPFLVSIGAPLAPFIREVLKNDDYAWQYTLLLRVVYPSPELARALEPELRQLANGATAAHRTEELDIIAGETLEEVLGVSAVPWKA